MSWEDVRNWWEIIALVILLAASGLLLLRVLNKPPSEAKGTTTTTPAAQPTAVVKAKKDLPAFKLLEESDLDDSAFNNNPPNARLKYAARRLLVGLRKDDAVTDEVVATEAATRVMDNSMTVAVPATPATTLNGNLKLGDVVELVSLIAVDTDGNVLTPLEMKHRKVQGLVVVGLPDPAPSPKPEGAPTPVVTLATNGENAQKFVEVLEGTSLTVLRYPPGFMPPTPTPKPTATPKTGR